MAEQAEKKSGSKTILKIVIGIVLIVLGLALVIVWWPYLLGLIQGCLGLFLIMAGAITIAIAKE
jgi:hypothetical protein